MKPPPVEYIPDETVNATDDRRLRRLLSPCFTKPEDYVFKEHRYFHESPAHRWVVRGPRRRIIANVVIHDKAVRVGRRRIRIGGVGDVCVHPDYRGRGYVRHMLAAVHAWLQAHDYPFAVLFGRPEVYRSSGYASVKNVYCAEPERGARPVWKQTPAMIIPLTDRPWPRGKVYLPGLKF